MYPVFLGRQSLMALATSVEVDDDGKDRDFVSGPEQRVVLEHPCGKFLVVAGLDLDMDENELGFAVVRGELGHDVGPPGAALGEVGEDFLVEKLDVPEVEPALDIRKKEPKKRAERNPAGTFAGTP